MLQQEFTRKAIEKRNAQKLEFDLIRQRQRENQHAQREAEAKAKAESQERKRRQIAEREAQMVA